MSDYSSPLQDKPWGSTGNEFPDNYYYVEGEAPVDAWDNWLNDNYISDIDHLIQLTNSRIESAYGTDAEHPSSPGDGNQYWDNVNKEVQVYNSSRESWLDLAWGEDLRAHAGDTGNPHEVTYGQVGAIEDASGTVTEDHLAFSTATQSELESHESTTDNPHEVTYSQVDAIQDAQGIISESHLGFDTATQSDLNSHAGLTNNPHSVSLEQARSESNSIAGALDISGNVIENFQRITSDSASTYLDTYGGGESADGQVVVRDSYNSHQHIAKFHEGGDFEVPNGGIFEQGNRVATKQYVDNNSELVDVSEDGTLLSEDVGDINFEGHLNVMDDGDGTVSIDPTHNHDDRYYQQGNQVDDAATLDGNSPSAFAVAGHSHSEYLQKSGGTMSGSIDLGDNTLETVSAVHGGSGSLDLKAGGGNWVNIGDSMENYLQIKPGPQTVNVPNGFLQEGGNRVATRNWTNNNYLTSSGDITLGGHIDGNGNDIMNISAITSQGTGNATLVWWDNANNNYFMTGSEGGPVEIPDYNFNVNNNLNVGGNITEGAAL